jgi:hypothetical protein
MQSYSVPIQEKTIYVGLNFFGDIGTITVRKPMKLMITLIILKDSLVGRVSRNVIELSSICEVLESSKRHNL